MKKVILSLLLCIVSASASAYATEATEYLENLYSSEYQQKVKIVSKREFINKYEQELGGQFISSIVYGCGYMKKAKERRQKIIYVTFLENDCNVIWGYILPNKI